jgi:tRNA-specific 2-thiouridylase
MVCWNEGPYCTSDQDRADAAKVAAHLKVPFRVFDFRREYREEVINYFFAEYKAGRTPNPDVACNSEIKFGIFLKQALELGFDYVATGHYAQVVWEPSLQQFKLLKGSDPNKDQSYFLYKLTQKQLNHVLFPIGHLTKTKVREVAASLNLPNAKKKDSQGICFVGDVEVREFLSQRIKNKIGDVITIDGRVIGKHKGLAFYTIGQREGVGFSEKVPYYVVGKDPNSNGLLVAPLGHPSHFRQELEAVNLTWVGLEPSLGSRVQVRIRYRQELVEAKIVRISSDKLILEFAEPQKAITPGQAVVLYQKEQVLGGGTIADQGIEFPKTQQVYTQVYR